MKYFDNIIKCYNFALINYFQPLYVDENDLLNERVKIGLRNQFLEKFVNL